MKYLKMLGLAAVAAMGLMAFLGASSASATELTCTNAAKEKIMCPTGTEIDASIDAGTTLKLTGTSTITCTEGTVKGKTTNTGGPTETVDGTTEVVSFSIPSCPNCTSIAVTNGNLEIHTELNGGPGNIAGNGTLTGSGFTATINCFGVTCKYSTGNGLHMGTLTGSSNLKGATATMDIDATLTRDEANFLCTSTATWEGSYTVTSPDWLDVD